MLPQPRDRSVSSFSSFNKAFFRVASTQAVSKGGGSTPLSGMASGAFCSSLREDLAIRGPCAGGQLPPIGPHPHWEGAQLAQGQL